MGAQTVPAPYVGLRPFRESDSLFFFGRGRDIRVISSNIQNQSLTVLYGPSGVGKSSVLQAGVLPHLKGAANQAIVYFNDWQSGAFLKQLTAKCRRAIFADAESADEPLDDILQQAGRRFLLLLDQFEEYLLYHAEGSGQEFDTALARILNREDVETKVLIGIREDALSRLDQRFSIRVPGLFGNTLALEHLGPMAARDAIRQPIRVLNERFGRQAAEFRIEDELVEEVLRQVETGQLAASDSTGLGTATGGAGNHIETAFLQLVLTQLWEEEVRAGSRVLRLETLSKIGGAARIVERHVAAVMAQFSSQTDRDIAAAMFRFLVTPSRTKIAQCTPDLVSYAEAPQGDVQNVLSALSDRPQARILRRLANPERYEIFHDVLAQPILDWRRDCLAQKQRAVDEDRRRAEAERQRRELEQARALALAEQQRAESETNSARRLRWMLAAVIVALLLAVMATIHSFRKQREAQEFAEMEMHQRQQAQAAKSEAVAAQKQAEASRSEAQAAQAALRGQRSDAERLRAEAGRLSVEAQLAKREANYQREQLSVAAEGRSKEYRDALQQIEGLRSQLRAAQAQRDQLKNELDNVRKGGAKQESLPQAAAKQQQPVSSVRNLQPPILIRRPLPEYPAQARAARVEGPVRLSATVRADGTIGQISPISGDLLLMGAAIVAVKQWAYQPALINGEPGEHRIEIGLRFSLSRGVTQE